MSSLTGQQIQNSYEGLLKTENNGPVTNAETNITDGVGNQTGLYTNSQYGIAGYKGVNQYPQWGIKNTDFDVNLSPLGASGQTTLSFLDINDFKTASIAQNRFGGLNYFNNIDGQSHIFGGYNGNSPIRMDSFNSPNNSDNWYSGYQNSVTDFSIIGSDITLTRADNTPFTITVPSGGGGGGQEVRNLGNTRPIATNNFGSADITWKLTHMTTGYGASNYQISSPTEFMVVPFTEIEGGTINDLSFYVATGVAGAKTNIHLYKANVVSNNDGAGGTQDVLDGQFVADIALDIDCSTSGQKFITGINQVLPQAEDNLYYFLYRMDNGVGVNLWYIATNQVINPNNAISINASTPYRFLTWQSGGNTSAPTNLDLFNMSPSTGAGLIRTFYTIA